MPNLIPRNVSGSLARLREEIDSTFDSWLGRARRLSDGETSLPASFMTGEGPAIDVEELDDRVHVTAELPGLKKEDFNVEITGNRLVLRGEKKAEREEKEGDVYYSERSYGSFARAIPLPAEVKAEEAKATYKDGVLHLDLPKAEEARPRRIDVKIS